MNKKQTMASTLRAAFKSRGLSIRQVSKEAGINYSVAHGFFTGDRDIKLATFERLCQTFNLQLVPRKSKDTKNGT